MPITGGDRRVRAPFVALALLAIAALITFDAVLPAIHRAHQRHEAAVAAHREAVENAELAVARQAANQIALPKSFRLVLPGTTSRADAKACGFDAGYPSATCWLYAGTPTQALPALTAALHAARLTPQAARCHRFPKPASRLQIPAHTDRWIDAHVDHQDIELNAAANLVFPHPPFGLHPKVRINGSVIGLSIA